MYSGPNTRGASKCGPTGGVGGSGRGGSVGKQEGIEGDRWGKRVLPPPATVKSQPSNTRGGAVSSLPALHKVDNKFKVMLQAKLPCLPAVSLFCCAVFVGCSMLSHPVYQYIMLIQRMLLLLLLLLPIMVKVTNVDGCLGASPSSTCMHSKEDVCK